MPIVGALVTSGVPDYGCTLGGTTGKGREPQIMLKTDERDLVLELGARVKLVFKSSSWEKNRAFVERHWVMTPQPTLATFGPRQIHSGEDRLK